MNIYTVKEIVFGATGQQTQGISVALNIAHHNLLENDLLLNFTW